MPIISQVNFSILNGSTSKVTCVHTNLLSERSLVVDHGFNFLQNWVDTNFEILKLRFKLPQAFFPHFFMKKNN